MSDLRESIRINDHVGGGQVALVYGFVVDDTITFFEEDLDVYKVNAPSME